MRLVEERRRSSDARLAITFLLISSSLSLLPLPHRGYDENPIKDFEVVCTASSQFFFLFIWFEIATFMRWKQPCLLVCRINVLFQFSFTKKSNRQKKEQIKCWWRSPYVWLLTVAFVMFYGWVCKKKYKIRLDGLRNHVIWIGCRWLKMNFLLSSEEDLKRIKKIN